MKKDYLQIIKDLLAIVFLIFHLYLIFSGLVPNIIQRSIHLCLALPLIYLYFPINKSKTKLISDILLASLSFVTSLYIAINYEKIIYQYGIIDGKLQIMLAIIMILLILEAARRCVKPALPIISLLFLMYAFFGHLLPGHFGHVQLTPSTILGMLYLTTNGIWGMIVGISVNIIVIFIMFGAFMVESGGGKGFINFSLKLAGRFKGGPAKVAVLSSALFGSISGSASANVATTGVFTIPMMKKLKYDKSFAAGVEAAASSGGQIMPPIMGAGIFIMAELIQIPYLKIALSATLPAILYFYAIGIGIHFYSLRENMKSIAPQNIPSTSETLKTSGFFVLPLITLLYFLFKGYTPQYSAFWAFFTVIILFCFNLNWQIDFKSIWPKFYRGFTNGARQAAVIASITACASIIIGIINQTGLGVKLSSFILDFSKGNLFLALFLTMGTSLILGMEVPTTAAYLVAAVIGAPALIKLGIMPLAAHLFIFYFAIISAITPPVCGAVYIASGIAGANWVKSAKYALILGFSAFLIPYLFVYDNSFLLKGSNLDILYSIVRSLISITIISSAVIGFLGRKLNLWERGIVLISGILVIIKSPLLNITGLGILFTLIFIMRKVDEQKSLSLDKSLE